jgi:hypothetical protein
VTIANIFAYSATKLDNDDLHDVPIDPGQMKPSDVNDFCQYVMADIKSGIVERGADLTITSTLNLDSVKALIVELVGATTVTAVTLTNKHWRICRAGSAFQLTASATLIVNGSTTVNHTVPAGAFVLFEGFTSSTVTASVITRHTFTTVDNSVLRADGVTGLPQTSGIVIDDSSGVTATFTDAGATAGPVYDLYRISATPAAADQIGTVQFSGRDSGGNKEFYATITGIIADPTAASEDGSIAFTVMNGGAFAETARISGSSILVGVASAFSFTSGSEVGAYIQKDGNWGARSSAQVSMQLGRLASDGTLANFYRETTLVGSISVTASATAYNTSSDERLKENFRDFDPGPTIDAINLYEYDWRNGAGVGFGPRAQELYKVFPMAVTPGNDKQPGEEGFEPWQWSGDPLIALMLKELQMLRARVAELEAN